MITIENHRGVIEISQEYFANLVGHVASDCFGVVSMSDSTPVDGLRSLMKKDAAPNRGVKVRYEGSKLIVDLHIVVSYGVNISAIVKSIVHKVRYTVEEATGLTVAKVNVFVDKVIV